MTIHQPLQTPDALPPREERRPVALSGWLVRKFDDQAHDFVLDNLSYGGCRVQTAARLARGDKVRLNVLERIDLPATVRWRNAYGIGLAFGDDASARPETPRKIDRLPLRAEVPVRRSGRRAEQLAVSDLSRHGCCLLFLEEPAPEEWVWVSLPGLAPLQARVRWVDDRRAGVEFGHPIHEAVFDLLLLRWDMLP